MTPRPLFHYLRRLLLLLAAVALWPAAAAAQAGRLAGRVTDAGGAPLGGAQVRVLQAGLATISGDDGRFVFPTVPAGTWQVTARRIGYRPASASVQVGAGAGAEVTLVLSAVPTQLDEVVVSASRSPQRITEAPAAVHKIGAEAIANTVGNSFAGALKEVPGLDFVQVGMTAVAVNARGFNSSFNNRMLMMEDGRVAVLPENGLPVGQFTAIPRLDLAGVEVLVGPGAALYGADASNGVISLQTKDPREYPGATLEVAGGNRSYLDLQGRYAAVSGNFGFKVAGEYQEADDWSNTVNYGAGGSIPEIGVDWNSSVARVEGAGVLYGANDSRLEVSAGWSQNNGVGQTNVGRNQLVDWTYNFQQVKYATGPWFLNAYRTQSQAGDSYAINRYSTNAVLFPDASHDELRLMSDWPSDGQLYAAEAQHHFTLAPLANTRVVWGGQYRHDRISSDEEWLTDRQTGEPIGVDQFGVYAQTETPLTERFRLVLAARVDDHEDYDTQFSPKAGVVYKLGEDQAVRLTWNRAFKSPTTLQTRFFIPDFVPNIGVFGNREGFTVRDDAANILATIVPLEPEENNTWEVGYRGLLGGSFTLDASAYLSKYDNFIGSLQAINSVAAGTYAYDAAGNRIDGATDNPQTVLTYRNLGKATIYGTELGLRYYVSPKLDFSGTYSYLKLDDVEITPTDPQATALNSPENKFTLGLGVRDVAVANTFGGITLRRVNEYDFASGINAGTIEGFTTLDINAGYRLTKWGMQAQLTVANLYSCQGDNCGFGEKHYEMINMPSIGTMVFLGLRYTR